MRRFFCFYRQCIKIAARGNAPFANDWQWLIGIPVLAGAAIWLSAHYGITELSTGYPIADGVLGAAGAFVFTWIVAFVARFLGAPVDLYYAQKNRADSLQIQFAPRLAVQLDPADTVCNDVATFLDGSKAICIRLKVENVGTTNMLYYEGWLISIAEMPHISSTKLFWVPAYESDIDIKQGIPRYLQIFRITSNNDVIIATGLGGIEAWPVDQRSKFVAGNVYHFKIAIKGGDESAVVYYDLELDWTGNWETAMVRHVTR